MGHLCLAALLHCSTRARHCKPAQQKCCVRAGSTCAVISAITNSRKDCTCCSCSPLPGGPAHSHHGNAKDRIAKHHAPRTSISCSSGCIHICSCGTYAAAATAAETSKTIITLWPSCCLGVSLMQITFPESELTLLSSEGNILRDCNACSSL